MSEKLRVIFSETELSEKIAEVAKEINHDYGDEPVHLVGVLCGAAFFTCTLAQQLTMPVTMDFIRVQSYNGTESSGELKSVVGLSKSLAGKNVIIVEDIIDTGQTIKYLLELFAKENPKSIKICSMLNKPSRRAPGIEIEPDYCGSYIDDIFVVGYGLDYDQQYRNLPYIAELLFD